MDDFQGKVCGQGRYPLLRNRYMQSKQAFNFVRFVLNFLIIVSLNLLPEFIAKDHTFLGDAQSPAIARHVQCSLGFPHLSGKVRVAT